MTGSNRLSNIEREILAEWQQNICCINLRKRKEREITFYYSAIFIKVLGGARGIIMNNSKRIYKVLAGGGDFSGQ